MGGDGFYCRQHKSPDSRSFHNEERLLLRLFPRRRRTQYCSCGLAGSLRSLIDLPAIRLLDRPHRSNRCPASDLRALSDPDGRNRIARTTFTLLDHALEHAARPYTGGIPAYRIVKEGLLSTEGPTTEGKEMHDMRRRLEKLEALEVARGAEGILGSGALRYDHRMSRDVIGSFMRSGFNGGDFINEQVVPVVDESRRRARRDSLV